jgi:hypothetical protein
VVPGDVEAHGVAGMGILISLRACGVGENNAK